MKLNVCFGILILLISCKSNPSDKNVLANKEGASPALKPVTTAVVDPGQFPYAVSVKDLHQQSKQSSDILQKEGKPTVLMFWLTTCNPCAKEIRAIHANFDQWQKVVPFHLVAMSEDREENFNDILERTRTEQWPFETYWDFNRNFGALMPGKLNGFPQTFIFNKDGKLTWSKRGYLPGDESIFFEKLKEAARS
ncbi:MAG: TlpA disulfide reductase family protein [Saprospiraceae bacterium]